MFRTATNEIFEIFTFKFIEGLKPELVEEKFRIIENEYMGDQANFIFSLKKLVDMYLHSSHLMNAGLRGNLTNLYIFSAIGFVILIIACFNYIILSIGQSTLRTKEIGIVIFILSFLVSHVIVVVTILSHSISAASVNPAKNLRYE